MRSGCCHEHKALCSITGSASLRGGCRVAFLCTGSSQAGLAQASGVPAKRAAGPWASEVVTYIAMCLKGVPCLLTFLEVLTSSSQ